MQETSYCRLSSACRRQLCRALAALLPGLFAASAWAAEASVPYVPTPQDVVERMLEIARVGPADYVIDPGSGDGRIVATTAREPQQLPLPWWERIEERGRETLGQKFQSISGTALKHDFSGRIEGDAISGSVALSGSRMQSWLDWNAKRAAAKTGAIPHPISTLSLAQSIR